ncbi:related to beta-glucosidase [Phialocephala subalpina]|uniref:beta-glucosidase n=1 Tax=Phialocephala subalpina TaxID=576137 RepID=A0A1L7XKD1_9HELO|nr:related to beta-glucosidase [Phialocephala subalpina]
MPSLPKDFLWGYATAAYQVEGSTEMDGRGLSIWDTFSRQPSKTEDGKSGDVATDSYKRWEEDIALMKSYGVNAYRFSLSWSRIIPDGGRNDALNRRGIEHYRKFLLKLRENGIEPLPTLFHWDLPQTLQDRYLGFLCKDEIAADFENYARICFREFGDLVDTWLTINEPNIFALLGHAIGAHAPGRSSDRTKSPEGDSAHEPYIVGHNLLVAHAHAVKAYREDFAKEGGKIGIVINGNWAEPYDDTVESKSAAEEYYTRATLHLAEPVYSGDYPALLKKLLGNKLPEFTLEESKLLKGSSDFFGLNHYTSFFVHKRKNPIPDADFRSIFLGEDVEETFHGPDGVEIAPEAGLSWVRPVPWGFKRLLIDLWKRYGKDIWVTENGVICPGERYLQRKQGINDQFRINYFRDYVNAIVEAIEEGTVVKSYIGWSLLDNFEWQEGYTRFGVTWVDFEDGNKRYAKASAIFMKTYMQGLICS